MSRHAIIVVGHILTNKDIPHYPTSNISLVQVFLACLVLQSTLLLQSILLILLLQLPQNLQSFLSLQILPSLPLLQVLQVRQVRQALPSPLLEVPLVAAAPWIDYSQSTQK